MRLLASEPTSKESAIMGHQHVFLHRLQQLVGSMHFTAMDGLDHDMDGGMAATFQQKDTARLQTGTAPELIALAAKGGIIGLSIGGRKVRSIDGHHSQAARFDSWNET